MPRVAGDFHIIQGDCLALLEGITDETVDLIYLDPPFNTGENFGQFDDRWERQTDYLDFMSARLRVMHRVLKSSGSLYLHCDPTASHYLKVILDKIFGIKNFRNEIVWKRTKGKSGVKRKFPATTDTIFYYVKSSSAAFNPQYCAGNAASVKSNYRYDDNDGKGRYYSSDLSKPGGGGHYYDYKGYPAPGRGWICSLDKMRTLDNAGLLAFPSDPKGRIGKKKYLVDYKGAQVDNYWGDINSLRARATERTGWPTQKPVKLLERIIIASSSPGDLVLDPFCGSGTTGAAALGLGRQFIGMDISAEAVDLAMSRLNKLEVGK